MWRTRWHSWEHQGNHSDSEELLMYSLAILVLTLPNSLTSEGFNSASKSDTNDKLASSQKIRVEGYTCSAPCGNRRRTLSQSQVWAAKARG